MYQVLPSETGSVRNSDILQSLFYSLDPRQLMQLKPEAFM